MTQFTREQIMERLFHIEETSALEEVQECAEHSREVLEYNGKLRVRLTYAESRELIAQVELGRKKAERDSRWSRENLETWDRFWQGETGVGGIHDRLLAVREPTLTLKQLIWCQNSLTKTGQRPSLWFRDAIQLLREKEAGL